MTDLTRELGHILALGLVIVLGRLWQILDSLALVRGWNFWLRWWIPLFRATPQSETPQDIAFFPSRRLFAYTAQLRTGRLRVGWAMPWTWGGLSLILGHWAVQVGHPGGWFLLCALLYLWGLHLFILVGWRRDLR